MELTIQIPWLTRMRRMAIGLSLVLVLVAVALPASAAAPEGIEGEVTVVNGPEQPVPITGDVTADVTGSVEVSGAVTVDNDATDPVPVTGSVAADVTGSVAVSGTVAATQSGDWTVGLDATSTGHLADIDAATDGLTYDENGSLNVNIAGEQATANGVRFSRLGGPCVNGMQVGIQDDDIARFAITSPITAVTASATELTVFQFFKGFGTDRDLVYTFATGRGIVYAQSFPFPLDADDVTIDNTSDERGAAVFLCVAGLVP